VFVLPRLAGRAGIFKHGREEKDFGIDDEQSLTHAIRTSFHGISGDNLRILCC
jgi:hypothetical protein